MPKTLVILEVSHKQDYIFGSKRLRENVARSGHIRYVTSNEFFQAAADELYRPENLVYTGGGHAVLQFDTADAAKAFTLRITEAVLRQFDGLELFAKQEPYRPEWSPGENLNALSAALEAKKARRQSSFRFNDFGVEVWAETPAKEIAELLQAPEGWRYPKETGELNTWNKAENLISVVHIDGNAMGKRLEGIYEDPACQADWDSCCQKLRSFSEGIQRDFEQTFREMEAEVIRRMDLERLSREATADGTQRPANATDVPPLPFRPLILAGDDVCFLTAGDIGLECANIFLERLAAKVEQQSGLPYAACAGIALIHTKFPFHRAYDLAEELCGSAKRYVAELDPDSRVSAMDWHVEFGELKDSLGDLRRDYATQDGGRMELRPVTAVVPEVISYDRERSYSFFRSLCRSVQGERGHMARGKVKELRTAFQQGETESAFFLHNKEIDDFLFHAFEAEHGENACSVAREMLARGERRIPRKAFRSFETKDGKTVRRCLFFDAIEMMDHMTFLDGEVKE